MKIHLTILSKLLFAAFTGFSFIFSYPSLAQAPDWEWAKGAGGINYDRGGAITYTSDGNLLITGYFQESAVFDTTVLTSSLGSDVFIAKYSTTGALLWAKSVAGSSSAFPEPGAIYEDLTGNIYLVGIFGYYSEVGGGGDITFDESTSFTSWGNQDIFIAKYNPAGDFIWAKHIGSDQTDKVVSTMDAAGNIIFSGKLWKTIYFNSTADTLYPYHMFDIFLAEYDTSGSLIFYQHAASCTAVTEPQDITIADDGSIFLAGKYNGKPTFGLPVDSVDLEEDPYYDQGFIARYESSHGSFKWAYTAGNTSSYDYPLTLDSKGGGKLVMSGLYLSTASFGIFSDTLTLVAPPAAGYGEMYLVQFDTAGNADWAMNAGYATAGSLNFNNAYYKAGNLYIAGNYSAGPVVFGQGPDAVSIPYLHALFVADFNESGNLNWVNTAGGFYYEGVQGVTSDSLNNVYVTGFYLGGCSFPGTSITLSSAGYEDILIGRLDDIFVSLPENTSKQDYFIYPNPARDDVTINLGKEAKHTVQLFNLQGKMLYETISLAGSVEIGMRNFPNGIYFISLIDEEGNKRTNKLLKMQ